MLPPYFGIYYTRFATQIAIYGMAALSVDLLLGYTGLITFGQAGLFGVGAYAAGMMTVYGVTNAFVAWPLAVLISPCCSRLPSAACRCARAASNSSW